MKSTHLHAAPFTAALLATLFVALPGRADESEMFAQRQKAIQAQLEARRQRGQELVANKAVLDPPMMPADKTDLADDEPVIGVFLNHEARAYPLTIMSILCRKHGERLYLSDNISITVLGIDHCEVKLGVRSETNGPDSAASQDARAVRHLGSGNSNFNRRRES